MVSRMVTDGYILQNREPCIIRLRAMYLNLSIQSVEDVQIAEYRNESGEKYHKCELCADKINKFGRVYITNYGNKYHTDLNCSGIKRTIEMIRLSDVEGKGACSKCWKE